MDNIVEFQNTSFAYPESSDREEEVVLQNLTLSIERGSFVAILGHNGSGKSTLAKHFNAVLLPNGGKVYVNGMDTTDEQLLFKIRATVGMVFQNPDNQIVANVVEEDVAFAPENLGVEPGQIRKRVDDALKLVGMYEYREHASHLLSGGQKQRIAIAGVIAMQPRCIVLDEPTAMLDPQGRREVIETITRINREQGVTIVLITHHMKETIGSDRLIVMNDGEIIADGLPEDVFRNVELLKSVELDVPETTELMYELNKQGYSFSLDALTVDACAKSIFEVMKK